MSKKEGGGVRNLRRVIELFGLTLGDERSKKGREGGDEVEEGIHSSRCR